MFCVTREENKNGTLKSALHLKTQTIERPRLIFGLWGYISTKNHTNVEGLQGKSEFIILTTVFMLVTFLSLP